MGITKEEAFGIAHNDSTAITLVANKKSSGPGGQNVNKTETAIDLRYDFLASLQLCDEYKAKIRNLFIQHNEGISFNTQKQKKKDPWLNNVPTLNFDRDGNLCIKVSIHRSQYQNREESLDQLARLLYVLLQDEKERFNDNVPENIKKLKNKGVQNRLSRKAGHKRKKDNRKMPHFPD